MSLFEAVRAVASANVWSRGVELARAGAVLDVRTGADETVVRVAPAGAVTPLTVNLYADEEGWDCSCPSKLDACVHVAAAVIAMRRAEESGGALPKASNATTHIGYRFARDKDALVLERVLASSSSDAPIRTTLTALRSGRDGPSNAMILECDRDAEDALGFRTGVARVPRDVLPRLFSALSECTDITLEGKPVRVSPEAIQPRARVEDGEGGGFRIRLVRDSRIEEHFVNGVVRLGETLHPVGDGGLDPGQRQRLIAGLNYDASDVGRLVGEILPRLRSRLPLDVRTSRLPEAESVPPHLVVETGGDIDTLTVLPRLFYGDPPSAEVLRGQLVLLGGKVPRREEAMERKLGERLSELGLSVGLTMTYTGEAAVRMAARLSGQKELLAAGAALQRFRRVGGLKPQVELRGDALSMRFETADGGQADPARVLAAWRDGASLVPLLSGGWAPLPVDWLEQHGHRLADLLGARGAGERVPRHALFDLAQLARELDLPPPPELAGLASLLDGFEGIAEATLPADLRADLRPYQRVGVNWLRFLRSAGLGGVLADDMGLGKTLQALAAIEGRTLVVAPTSVLSNWCSEAARFRPGLRVQLYHGPSRALDPRADVTVTSYALLRLDASVLQAVAWDSVILDEAQAIKNPESQVARAAFGLKAEHRVTMTGTPVENRLDELWSQLHFLNPGLLGGRSDFADRYANPIANGDRRAALRLRERIRPFVLRRLKRDVAPELPPRTEVVLHCELDAQERAVYQTVSAATRRELVAAMGGGVMAALEALLRLRQAACHPALVPGQHAERSSKVDLLVETLDEVVAEGHKALVFSQWTSLLDLVEPHLHAANIGYCRLDGSTRDRGAVVAQFQDEAGPPVMLISLKAGGTGLNLTAADHVFLLDPWWNPAVEDQAADRAHRIGQDRPVLVCRLVATDTVEERILTLQARKRGIADAVLAGADQAGGITRAELMALLD